MPKSEYTQQRMPGMMNLDIPKLGTVGIHNIEPGALVMVILAKDTAGEWRTLTWTIDREDVEKMDADGFAKECKSHFETLKANHLIHHMSTEKIMMQEAQQLWDKQGN